mgnify:CR=1 FL=1
MNKLIELIEKGKPFFEKISRNKYLLLFYIEIGRAHV